LSQKVLQTIVPELHNDTSLLAEMQYYLFQSPKHIYPKTLVIYIQQLVEQGTITGEAAEVLLSTLEGMRYAIEQHELHTPEELQQWMTNKKAKFRQQFDCTSRKS